MIQDFIHYFQGSAVFAVTWQMCVMWVVCLVLFYLAVYKQFEPLLLVPIAFGALMANLPTRGVITQVEHPSGVVDTGYVNVTVAPQEESAPGLTLAVGKGETYRVQSMHGGLYDFISQGIKLEIFPPLIFLGVGALTDFGPLIANPRTLFLGAAAQFGIFVTFFGASLMGFTAQQAASIGIIGGADGPTSIFTTNKLAPELLGPVAVAAYSYMALVPLIQPPIMRLLTTRAERRIRMKSLRPVSREEKLVFALLVTVVCVLLVPDASALIAMLMFGNFLRECGVTERLVKASQNEIINVITIFLGTSVGITMQGGRFLQPQTLKIVVLGVVAFGFATAGGVVVAKVMNWMSPKNPINPLIGSAGVSAVPMAARVSHLEGQRADPNNYLLMHAMGPNVAGVIGTAVAAGYFISTLGH
jgi:carboxybiotin decarboxylase